MIQKIAKLNKDEKYVLGGLKRKEIKCSNCNENTVRRIPNIMWDLHTRSNIYPREILRCNKYYCFNCKTSFENVKQLAMIDGIFLDKNTNFMERTQKYVKEICKELELSDDVRAKSTEILRDYNEKWGCRTVAGASIYISSILCGERRTQQEVGDASNVSVFAIRKNYVDIAKKLDIDIL